MKKFLAITLTLILMFSGIVVRPIKAHATENISGGSIAEKTSEVIDENGRFKVEIQVPGGDGKEYHDEVIIMVDGSYSTDDDWSTTRSAILEIGKTVLEGSGNTLLTVMTFGMGDNVVVQHVASVSELDATLTQLPGGLLYGRSSTNCEAGFTGIAEYIGNHDGTLNEVHVVYITDGEINTDETEYVFYNWTENTWLKKDLQTLIRWALSEECGLYANGQTKLSNAYTTVFGNIIYTAEDVMTEGVISDEDTKAWADQVWADVYSYSEMQAESAYAVSDAERAFVKYDKENGTHVQEMFYYALWGRSYPDRFTRTPDAGLELAVNEKVAHLYMVDSNKATSWMSDLVNTAENITFYEAGSVSNLLTALEGVLTNLAYTPYNDVVVTDYMSKWVNLDASTIKVVDNNIGVTIWTNADGWLISENRPTSQEKPVVVEEVPFDKYAEGGSNVVGNENGTIYKLTWYVKDGAMLRNHNYSLIYEVDVDTKETGFKYDTYYPANGNTTIDYTEKNGDDSTEITEDIDVPDVIVDKPETVNVSGMKTWEDEDDKYGERPESITVNLMADGVKVDSKTVSSGDNWTYSFGDMLKYNAEDKEIVYTVSEEVVENYESKVNGYNITNTYIKPAPETINISGTKTWEDEDDKYGERPESITVNLMADGVKVDSKTVSSGDNWAYSFEEVLKYNAEDKEIVYTVSEEVVENYETKVNGYNITNTYIKPAPETINISGMKTWEDEDDKYGERPESITVNLMADGVKVDSKTVSSEDNWTYSFENMLKYNAEDKEIVYTVSEEVVKNYETKINGYNITNTYIKPVTDTEDSSEDQNQTWEDDEHEEIQESIQKELAPETGDSGMIYLWLAMAIISGSMLIILGVTKKRINNRLN